MNDEDYMQLALAEAEQAATAGEVPVGALVVVGQEIVGRGHNTSIAWNDPSAHAEIVALRAAGESVGNYRLPNATLYVTLEPCTMCVGAMVHARISRVVFGAYDDKAGALGGAIDLSDSAAFNHRLEVQGGVCADDCAAKLTHFFSARRR